MVLKWKGSLMMWTGDKSSLTAQINTNAVDTITLRISKNCRNKQKITLTEDIKKKIQLILLNKKNKIRENHGPDLETIMN